MTATVIPTAADDADTEQNAQMLPFAYARWGNGLSGLHAPFKEIIVLSF
jgi:hypothetical protein